MIYKGRNIEIMSPVGSYESLAAAIQANAEAIYFGIGKLNMRARSSANFSIDDMENIISIAKSANIKTYLTLNTIIYDDEIEEMKTIALKAKQTGIDAIIATDFSVLEFLKENNIRTHISTQISISNIESVKFFSQYADAIILARELSLEQVRYINEQIKKRDIRGPSGNLVETEIFVHGALCMAISGKCYLSLDNTNFSANRGECMQICRRSYIVKDKNSEIELEIDNENIMSPKDLCTIGFLDKILEAGVTLLKIEGRGRSADYVKTTTRCYKEAVKAIIEGNYCKEKIEEWTEELKKVFNRGFWDGYYLGKKIGEWTDGYGNKSTRIKEYVGKVTNYFSNISVAEIKIETGSIKVGDEILIIGPTTGVVETLVNEIRVDLIPVQVADRSKPCSIKVPSLVRRNDKVYLWKKQDTK